MVTDILNFGGAEAARPRKAPRAMIRFACSSLPHGRMLAEMGLLQTLRRVTRRLTRLGLRGCPLVPSDPPLPDPQ